MSKNHASSTDHIARLESLRHRHSLLQQEIDEGMKHPPSVEIETYIKEKKLEKLKVKEEIEGVRTKRAS